ncbi:MAG: RNA polymerase subunit sigma-70, partial [Actinomycetota bacterium]|nr:RNA polymerase subunit sigma-70 [Actinomycetota bacterium]
RAVANRGRLVRLPVHTGQAVMSVLREERRLEDSTGGRASAEDIAAGLGLPVEQVSSLLRLAPEPLSISEPLGPEGPELAAVVADSTAVSPAERVAASLLPAEVERLLDALDRRDRQVVILRFGLDGDEPWGLDAIGRHVGLSREGVRQSQTRALRTLRRLAFASPETRELLAR